MAVEVVGGVSSVSVSSVVDVDTNFVDTERTGATGDVADGDGDGGGKGCGFGAGARDAGGGVVMDAMADVDGCCCLQRKVTEGDREAVGIDCR